MSRIAFECDNAKDRDRFIDLHYPATGTPFYDLTVLDEYSTNDPFRTERGSFVNLIVDVYYFTFV